MGALIFMDPTLGEQVDEEILSREGISTWGRSVLQDIQAYENILKNPLSYVDRGLLALKYRSCMASVFKTKEDPIKTEAVMQSCSSLSRLFFTRRTGLPSLINPAEGMFALNAGDLQAARDDNEEKDKKKDKKDKKSKKEKKKDKKKKKKGKKGKKDKKDKKKKKKDKKGKKSKKDKKKDKKDKKKDKKEYDLSPVGITDQFDKFALISEYLNRSDSSIAQYLPCLKMAEALVEKKSPEAETYNQLRRAAEFEYRTEECWRNYLTQVRRCRYSDNPGQCAASFVPLETECSLYGLEAHRSVQELLS